MAGGTYHLSVVGQPGETVFTMYSEHADATYVPLYFGPQLTAYPITFVLEGVIPPSGLLEKDVPVPPLSTCSRASTAPSCRGCSSTSSGTPS